jgi:acyl carrier protein
MEIKEILKKVNEIFIDVLDNDDIVIKTETTANDVEDCDSLTNNQLVLDIVKKSKLDLHLKEFKVGKMLVKSWNL